MIFFKDIKNYLFGILATLIFSSSVLIIPSFLKKNFGIDYQYGINLWLFMYFILPNLVLIAWMFFRPPKERGFHIDLGKLSKEEKLVIKTTYKKTNQYEEKRVLNLKLIVVSILVFSLVSCLSFYTSFIPFYSQLGIALIVVIGLFFYVWFITYHLFIYYEAGGHFYSIFRKIKPQIETKQILNIHTKYLLRKILWEFCFSFFLFLIIVLFFFKGNTSISYKDTKASIDSIKIEVCIQSQGSLDNQLKKISSQKESLSEISKYLILNEEDKFKKDSIDKQIKKLNQSESELNSEQENNNKNLQDYLTYYQLRGLIVLIVLLFILLVFWYHINLENVLKKYVHDEQQIGKPQLEKEKYEDMPDIEHSKAFLLYTILLIFPLFKQIDAKDLENLKNPLSIFNPINSLGNLFVDINLSSRRDGVDGEKGIDGKNGLDGKDGKTEIIVDTAKIAGINKRLDQTDRKVTQLDISIRSNSKDIDALLNIADDLSKEHLEIAKGTIENLKKTRDLK